MATLFCCLKKAIRHSIFLMDEGAQENGVGRMVITKKRALQPQNNLLGGVSALKEKNTSRSLRR